MPSLHRAIPETVPLGLALFHRPLRRTGGHSERNTANDKQRGRGRRRECRNWKWHRRTLLLLSHLSGTVWHRKGITCSYQGEFGHLRLLRQALLLRDALSVPSVPSVLKMRFDVNTMNWRWSFCLFYGIVSFFISYFQTIFLNLQYIKIFTFNYYNWLNHCE